ncbi:Hypothetical predicted protein [Mytilus galloprovincialis]|uniref:Uncharacterized protein n=1 Tax=Mytilus galloprovincialis TaxID=29158 RepID=A0A8B6CI94_MYTGA|nr:Hypothetical predicted protein [Mytilus galloprovincialis]
MNPTVLTLGHSYIRRLSNYCKMNRMSTNFGITYINGIMYGKGGTKLCNMIQDHVFQRLISKFSPTIVVLQIGGKLKVEKQLSLNKIGHALHVLNPVFKKLTFDERIKAIAKSISLVDPVVCQSMYIFKQPGIGGEVIPHQDATFLHTDPMKLFGIWIALEDAKEENGCLYFIPGSHKSGIYGNRRMIRNPDKSEGQPTCTFRGEVEKFDDNKWVPAPVKKGGLVLIHGEVVHKSEKNTSDQSRNIYTFHVFDQKNTKYSEENWLQPSEAVPFTPLYDTSPE